MEINSSSYYYGFLLVLILLVAGAALFFTSNPDTDNEPTEIYDEKLEERAIFLSSDVFKVYDFMPEGFEVLSNYTRYNGAGVYETYYAASGPSFSEFERVDPRKISSSDIYISYGIFNHIDPERNESTVVYVEGKSMRNTNTDLVNNSGDYKEVMKMQFDRVFRLNPSKVDCTTRENGAECSVIEEIGGEKLIVWGQMRDTYPASYELSGCIIPEEAQKEQCFTALSGTEE